MEIIIKKIPNIKIALLALILSFSSIAISNYANAAVDPAFSFIEKLSKTSLMSLTEKTISRSSREKRVRHILRSNFDIKTIGRFALGTHWRSTTKKQRKEYLKLFEDMIVQTYTTRFENYSGQKLKVKKAIHSGKRDTLVSTQIIQKGGPPLNIEWRVRNKKGKLRIIDVVVEGISMSVTQRSDFSSVIQNAGGDIEALITMLRERQKRVKHS